MSAVRLPEVVVGREASVRNVRAGELPIAKLLPKSVKEWIQEGVLKRTVTAGNEHGRDISNMTGSQYRKNA